MNLKFSRPGKSLLSGSIAALTIAVLLKLSALQPLEQMAQRALFQMRGPIPWDSRLVLITIDDASLSQLGRFPWSRERYVELLQVLSTTDPALIIFDLIWSEPTSDDAPLAQAMTQQGRVVLAQAWDATGSPLIPVPELQDAAIATGHILVQPDANGFVRTIHPQIQGQPALGIATTQAYGLVHTSIPTPSLDRPLWINWPGHLDQLQQYSFVDVLNSRIPEATFRNKIVLVGVTATGLDGLVTSFSRNPPASSVFLQAAVLNSLLQQNYLKPLDAKWLGLILLLGGPGLSWAIVRWNKLRQLTIVTTLSISWFVLGLLLLQVNYLIPIAPPILLFMMTTGAIALCQQFQENKLLQQQVSQFWATYREDLVLSVALSSRIFDNTRPDHWVEAPIAQSKVAQLAALAELFARSQSAQAAIARNLSIGLVAADLDGQVWFCNPVASAWLDIQVGHNLTTQLVPDWLTHEQWQADLRMLTSVHGVAPRELNRGDRWFWLKLDPLIYPAAQLKSIPNTQPLDGFLLLIEDTTERVQAEAELKQAKEASEAANRAKSDFLSKISHELRTPLNAILGYTQILNSDSTLHAQHQDYVNIINHSGEHLLSLINNVLTISKIEAGQTNLHQQRFDLYSLLDSLKEMLKLKAESKGLSLIFEYAPGLPQFIYTDEGKLRQVLINLLGNAIKFTAQGHVILRVAFSKAKSSDRQSRPTSNGQHSSPPHPTEPSIQLLFEIEDTGPGIAFEDINALFSAFAQGKVGQQSQEGTGLGLPISRQFVRLMGGEITVSSQLNQGSIFRFDIQVATAQPEDLRPEQPIRKVIGLAPGQPTYRILVAEDNRVNRLLLVKLLTHVGFQVREARHGEEALEIWKSWHPDLIWMDMQMPVMDGYDATRCIREGECRRAESPTLTLNIPQHSLNNGSDLQNPAQPWTLDIPSRTAIIALTASAFEEDQKSMISAGCDGFVSKPFKRETIFDQIAQHLGAEYVYEDT